MAAYAVLTFPDFRCVLLRSPATFTLTVVGAFDYSLSALPSTLPVTQGGVAGVETVTAVLTSGQTQSVSFSNSGMAHVCTPFTSSPPMSSSHFADSATTCYATLNLTATCSAVAFFF